jgi:hypothetical protein
MSPTIGAPKAKWIEEAHPVSSYLVYICQAVKNRAGLERYWRVAPAAYPKNIDVLVGYAPFEVLDADQEERVEGVVLAEFPPFEETVEWFNSDAYVRARKDRIEGNEYLGIVVDGEVALLGKRSAGMPAYVIFEVRRHRENGAKYLVILSEGGVPPVEQRMPQTRIRSVGGDAEHWGTKDHIAARGYAVFSIKEELPQRARRFMIAAPKAARYVELTPYLYLISVVASP